MVVEFFTSPSSSTNLSKMNNKDKSMKLLIIPVFYLIFVLIATSFGARAPYPIFDFVNPSERFYSKLP